MAGAYSAPGMDPRADLPAGLSNATAPSEPSLVYGVGASPVAVMVEANFYDSGSFTTQRWSDRGLIFDDNTFYEARLLGPVQISQSAMDRLVLGDCVALTASAVTLANGDRALDDEAAQDTAIGRLAVIKTVAAPNPSASDAGGDNTAANVVFTGVVAGFGPAGRTVDLSFGDFSEKLTVPLQANFYNGNGGLGGTSDLKGLPKPISLGWRYNVTPIYIGLVNFGDGSLPTYQTNWQTILGHGAVRERGVAMVATNSAPGVGQYRDWPQNGCFQLGFTADGIITCDVSGDASDDGYAGTTASVIRRLLKSLGPLLTDADLDAATFSLVPIKLPGEIGWGIGTDTITAHDALEQIVQHCGAVMSGNRQGLARLAITAPAWPAVQLTLDQSDIVSLVPVALPAALVPTPQAVTITAAKNWTPLSDIAGSVTDPDRTALAGSGSQQRATNATTITRVKTVNELQLPGLYRYPNDALARAQAIVDWLAGGLRAFEVTNDRYLNQVEIGHMANVTYPFYGLDAGFTGVVAEWTEIPSLGRVTMTIVG